MQLGCLTSAVYIETEPSDIVHAIGDFVRLPHLLCRDRVLSAIEIFHELVSG